MNEPNDKEPKPSLKDLLGERKPGERIDLEGHQFTVMPLTVGLMKKLSGPDAQNVNERDVGIQALRETVDSGGKEATAALLDALTDASMQALAIQSLECNGFSHATSDALYDLGAAVKNRKNIFALPESLNIGKTVFAQLDKMNRASRLMAGYTSQLRPDLTHSNIDFGDRPTILKSLDFSHSPQARAAEAAEATEHLMKDVLAAQGAMLKHMGDLADSLINIAIPKWLDQVSTAEIEAKRSADRANMSLRWAVAAVVVSVLCTLGTTVFDSFQSDGDEVRFNTRADAIESLMLRQIEQNSKLFEAAQLGRSEQFGQLSALRDQVNKSATTQESINATLSRLLPAPHKADGANQVTPKRD